MRDGIKYVNISTALLEKVVKTYRARRDKTLTTNAEALRHVCNFYLMKCAEDTEDDDI